MRTATALVWACPTLFHRSRPPRTSISRRFFPVNTTGAIYLDDPHLRTPYVYQYNLSLQRNLFADTVLEANYVGSSGRGLTSLKDINPTVLGTTNRLLNGSSGNCGIYPGVVCYGQLPEFQNVSNANYNALEASLTRQPKDSRLGTVYYTFAYTYGHNIDNASGFAQRNCQLCPPTTPIFSTLPATATSAIASASAEDGICPSIAHGLRDQSASPRAGASIPSLLIAPDSPSTSSGPRFARFLRPCQSRLFRRGRSLSHARRCGCPHQNVRSPQAAHNQ